MAMKKRSRGRPETPLEALRLRGSEMFKRRQQPPISGENLAYENFKAAVLAAGFSLAQAHQLISGGGDTRGFDEPECSKTEKLHIGTPQEYSSKTFWYSDLQMKKMLQAWVKLRKIIYTWIFTENLCRRPVYVWPRLLPAAWWMFETTGRNEKETEGQQLERMGFRPTIERLYEKYILAAPNPENAREILECQFEARYARTQAE
jgi:hypothetical protein